MASLSLYPKFETNLLSNRNVIELLLQLKSAKAHGKNYMEEIFKTLPIHKTFCLMFPNPMVHWTIIFKTYKMPGFGTGSQRLLGRHFIVSVLMSVSRTHQPSAKVKFGRNDDH